MDFRCTGTQQTVFKTHATKCAEECGPGAFRPSPGFPRLPYHLPDYDDPSSIVGYLGLIAQRHGQHKVLQSCLVYFITRRLA